MILPVIFGTLRNRRRQRTYRQQNIHLLLCQITADFVVELLIISCIDNLLKGASGQAVHNMNLMFNLEETVGLRLKPSAF